MQTLKPSTHDSTKALTSAKTASCAASPAKTRSNSKCCRSCGGLRSGRFTTTPVWPLRSQQTSCAVFSLSFMGRTRR